MRHVARLNPKIVSSVDHLFLFNLTMGSAHMVRDLAELNQDRHSVCEFERNSQIILRGTALTGSTRSDILSWIYNPKVVSKIAVVFKVIDHRDPLLSEIISLGERNSKTLGMFPEGAFMDHARKRTIIAALVENNFAGYILYRIVSSKQLVSITHLCIDERYRGAGLSRMLLDQVKIKYEKILSGIGLSCREDYVGASKVWETFGFKAIQPRRSRSKGEHYLIKWRFDFGNPDLFTSAERVEKRISAMLDCSVLIPMSDEPAELNREAHALNSDWLKVEADFYFAQEVYNELNRDSDKARAAQTRAFLRRFREVKFKPDERDKILQQVADIKPGNTPNDRSDQRQIAECISSGIRYFITLDERILDLAETLYQAFSIHIIRPVDFILLIDEYSNAMDYHSLRMSGANYESGRMKTQEAIKLVKLFAGRMPNANQSDLRKIIVKCASDKSRGIVRTIKDNSGKTIAFYCTLMNSDDMVLECVRVLKLRITNVLFQQIIKDIIQTAILRKVTRIIVRESSLDINQCDILESFGFMRKKNVWEKVVLKGMFSFDVLSTLEPVKAEPDLKHSLGEVSKADEPLRNLLKLKIERQLWPAKILDLDLPCYIIPIRPHWASQLFDFYASSSDLFGAKETLAWSRENVYYRNVKPVSERAPGRILWYVSAESGNYSGRTKGIVACSYLDDVYVDRVKDVWKKCKNFGVYEWQDVYELAKGEIMSDIKALKFSETEVFQKLIPLEKVNELFIKNGRPKNTFASPVEISSALFNDIYRFSIHD